MAEAVVEVPTRYYCHMCREEINIPNSDFTCPICAGGFIEALPDRTANGTSSLNSPAAGPSSNSARGNRFAELDALRGEIATLLMSRNGPNVEISIDPGNRRRNLITLTGGNSPEANPGAGSAHTGANNTGGGRVHPPTLDRLDNVLLDFLQSISGGAVDFPFGNSQMFFMGNPGDYAWGREGLDSIVTQLLNQIETTGPPPLTKDKIDEIPKVQVTADDVDKKMQCSVCWEDFKLSETVRRLPCSHIYHEDCIVPWLNLHGTCPICRKSLSDEEGEDSGGMNATDGNRSANTQSGNHPDIISRITSGMMGGGGGVSGNANASGGASASNQTRAGSGAGNASHRSQQNRTNNIFTFDNNSDNVDLD